jgi:hyaluronate lyase
MRKIIISLIIIISFCGKASANISKQNALQNDDYDALRIKWKNTLIGSVASSSNKYIAAKKKAITKEAQMQWSNLDKSKGRTFLWPDLNSTKVSAEITYAYCRIYAMALAYNIEGSPLKNNKTLRDDIISALLWMNENRYVKLYNNWWDFQIGAPLELNNCITLMYDDLSETQHVALNDRVAKLTGNPATDTGANRAWRAFVYALNGILKKDSLKIEIAKNSLSAIFEYVEKGDGFSKDGSFIQHANHPYSLGYGIDAIAKLSDLMNLLDGSMWKVTDANNKNLYSWIYHSFEPLIYKGVAMDLVRGREMSRHYKEDYIAGFTMIGIVAKLTQFAPSADATVFKNMVNYWVMANRQRNYFTYAAKSTSTSINTIIQVQNIVNNANSSPKDRPDLYKQYVMMDRALKRGPGFAFGISMHSTRVANYEGDVNQENLKGWHTASGMTYLYNDDVNQYSNNFWPTVNSYRLPGTTILQTSPITNDKTSDRNWVGGVSLAELYGVTGMDYHAIGYNLQAKKSWFMFDNEIVALGAGISGMDNKDVETIVENRKLSTKGTNQLLINGKRQPAAIGWQANDINEVKHVHLSGNVSGSDIGYYFPNGAKLNALREARTANWKSINANPATMDTVNHTNNFFTLWFNHGSNPFSATYSYVLLPGFTAKQVFSYATKPQIEILRNDSLVQAVKETGLKITAANFWTDTEQSVDMISCNKKASVILQQKNQELLVSVSDPTMLNEKFIRLTINKSAKEVILKDNAVEVIQLHPTIIVNINVKGALGSTFKVIFKYD